MNRSIALVLTVLTGFSGLVYEVAWARRLELTTVGLLQYLAPTGQFVTALLLTGEAFDRSRAIAFGLIWVGLAIFTTDAVRRHRLGRRRSLEMVE